jgi:hypothetical protein
MATTSEDVWRLLAELATAQAELTAAQKTQRIRSANWGTRCQIRQLYRRTCPSFNGNDSQTTLWYGSC